MTNEKIAILGVIVIVVAVISSVTAVAVNGTVDVNTYKDIIIFIGGSATGLIGFVGGARHEKIKHKKDFGIGLDYHENEEGDK